MTKLEYAKNSKLSKINDIITKEFDLFEEPMDSRDMYKLLNNASFEYNFISRNFYIRFAEYYKNGEYLLLSKFKDYDTDVLILHEYCGRIFRVNPKTLFMCPYCYEYECKDKFEKDLDYKQKFYKKVDNRYTLITSYLNKSSPILVKCNKCGTYISCRSDKFFSKDKVERNNFRCPNKCNINKNKIKKSKRNYNNEKTFKKDVEELYNGNITVLLSNIGTKNKCYIRHRCGYKFHIDRKYLLNIHRIIFPEDINGDLLCKFCKNKISIYSLNKDDFKEVSYEEKKLLYDLYNLDEYFKKINLIFYDRLRRYVKYANPLKYEVNNKSDNYSSTILKTTRNDIRINEKAIESSLYNGDLGNYTRIELEDKLADEFKLNSYERKCYINYVFNDSERKELYDLFCHKDFMDDYGGIVENYVRTTEFDNIY